MMHKILYLILLLSLLISCGRKKLSAPEYLAWYKGAGEELTRTKQINGYEIRLKYIPAEYLTYKDLQGAGFVKKDSIAEYYQHNLNFVLSIRPLGKEEGERNIMFDRLEKFEDYKKRVFDLNFNMEELVELKLDKGIALVPSIYNVENTYGLSKELNFNLVFSPKAHKDDFDRAEEIDVVLNDYIFETGISHFVFKKKDLENLPILL